jgi:hypothetical protein
MKSEILPYIDILKQRVQGQISDYIMDETASRIASDAFKFHFIKNKGSLDFQIYYSNTVSNRQYFLFTDNFFRVFKQKYALQGIDNNYLNRLEQEKATIIQLIDDNELATLYFKYFAKAQIQHGKRTVTKNLGSFFAKLVHTFRPNDFCALDNPIKNYFGLRRESFYVAFVIISHAYKEWAGDNAALMHQVRMELENINEKGNFYSSKMTDLKLLDLIFWGKAKKWSRSKSDHSTDRN